MKAFAIAASCVALLTGNVTATEHPQPNVAEAKGIIKQFFGDLKGELETAIGQGGVPHAITVCKGRAPAIADELSAQSGWEVGRTSLKLRNLTLNQPDAWEQAILAQFETRKAQGEDLANMDHAEVVEQNGQKTFRYMKAIPTQTLCLNCHGTDIPPDVTATLDDLYPGDQARGFKEGDLRGAFTLSKKL